MTWLGLVGRNLLRRPSRTLLTAAGVAIGVGLIVALLGITNGARRTADALIHVGGADFGLYQGGVSDFTRSFLPDALARDVARQPGVAAVARVKLLVVGGTLVFGLDRREFAYRRFVFVAGGPGEAVAGDRSGRRVGQVVRFGSRSFRIAGVYHSANRFEDLGVTLPLAVAESLAGRPGEVTSLGVDARTGWSPKTVATRLQRRFRGLEVVREPGQAVQVDTSSRLIVSTGWIVSVLALIVGGIGVTNTMAMAVLERMREIGLLRAVGWRAWRVGALIAGEAVAICLLALGLGCAFGVVAAGLFVAHSALSTLITPVYTPSTFVWGLAFALGVALLGAASPTLRATRLQPIDALRRE
jgi:putative ABC transport system permease protein